jgi:NAD(P)H-dependent FMN reductase
MTIISVIVGSTRNGRFADKPARWIFDHLATRTGVEANLLDLREFPLPFFDEPVPPAMPGRAPYESDVVRRWTNEIRRSDGFIIVTGEYNYGPAAVLKNAIDWVYPEWNRKAVGFVGYGAAAGVRAIQQLRETAVELQLAPVRNAVLLPAAAIYAHFQGQDVMPILKESDAAATKMIDDLLWWVAALKRARAA